MTTPQNLLYELSYKIRNLQEMFEVEEGENTIFEDIRSIKEDLADIQNNQERLYDQLNLIIKLLSK